jgi:hypothetical protein
MNRNENDPLEAYREQFEAIEIDARKIVEGLTDVQLTWRPGPGVWSIRDCLDHLIETGSQSLFHIADAVAEGRAHALYGSGPFRYSVLERWMVWLMEPPPRLKFPAPRAYRPTGRQPPRLVVNEFFRLQDQLRAALPEAKGLNLARIKVRNPVSRWLRFSLGQEFAFTAAHERRHLWQIRQVVARAGFPAPGGPTA